MDSFDDEIFGRFRTTNDFINNVTHNSAGTSYQELLNRNSRNDYGGTIPLGNNTVDVDEPSPGTYLLVSFNRLQITRCLHLYLFS